MGHTYVIIGVNTARGLAVFQDSGGECGWFEILDTTELETGEEIRGDLSDFGDAIIAKESGETVSVYVENLCSRNMALKQVFQDRQCGPYDTYLR